MSNLNKNHRRVELKVESLESKTLLSTAVHHLAPEVRPAAVIDQAPGPFTGTLAGHYSNIHIPFAGNLLNYATSGTLSGTGSTRLNGSLFLRGAAPRPGRFAGTLAMHNPGGSMLIRIVQTSVTGTDMYKVSRATGNDAAYRGETGTLTITQNPTTRYPYFVSGPATMTFS